MKRLFVSLVAAFVLAACGGGGDDDGDAGGGDDGPSRTSARESFQQPFTDVKAYPVFVSSEVTVGENRFLVGLLSGRNDAPIASPDIEVSIDFFDLEQSAERPVDSRTTDFLWTVKPRTGLYVTDIAFDSPGRWGAEVSIDGPKLDETVKASFDVMEEATTPEIGDPAPASDTPTADEVSDLSKISTDGDPNPRFYDMSIADAVRSGEPSVITFATPKFCQTATCGPTLGIVKRVAKGFRDVNFVHVEPYELPVTAQRKVVPAAQEWGLPTEPWVFVIDNGRVQAKFEGSLSPGELKAALQSL
ncbi:MAG: hypothetical protein H0U16_05510 [Actinobacteria bacterium]|nr:hypothetical protein [Actinomycetota bacterium]